MLPVGVSPYPQILQTSLPPLKESFLFTLDILNPNLNFYPTILRTGSRTLSSFAQHSIIKHHFVTGERSFIEGYRNL